MSEQNQNPFPFGEITEQDGIDIASIFGGGTTPAIDPFADTQQSAAEEQLGQPVAPEPQSQTGDTEADGDNTPATPTHNQAASKDPAAQKQEKPKTQKQTAPTAAGDNPIGAAFAQKDEEANKAAAQSLFEKAPVFAYGSAKDPIADPSMTFEELRIAKAEDFPELGEGKRVSWSVEYGSVTQAITDPKGKTIQTVKEEIERSKKFLDGLKKAKDKSPDCLVKPRVTAQSKGIAAYKGLFHSVEEARASDKSICLIPSGDGKVYELRKTEMGEFIAPKTNVVDLEAVRAGFTPALPLIPQSLLQQIISFFRCYMDEKGEFEALAHILWDKEEQEFTVRIPDQTVSKARVDADLSREEYPEERYIHYADIHSHNSMAPKFSCVDDADEKATRIYIVVGHLDKFFPDITVRMSCGGTYLELDPGTVFESTGEAYPPEWRENVKTAQSLRIPVNARRLAPHFASGKDFFVPGEDL